MVTDSVGDPNPPRITSKVKEDTDSSGRVIRMGEGRERGGRKGGRRREKRKKKKKRPLPAEGTKRDRQKAKRFGGVWGMGYRDG